MSNELFARDFFRRRAARAAAVATLGLMVFPAGAGDILRGSAGSSPSSRRGAAATTNAGAASAAQTQGNARDRLSRTTQSLDAVKAMQVAARAAAGAKPRLADPARPGKKLPRVTDGLSKNGLELAVGVPKNLNRPKAGENPALWVGADLPGEKRGKGGKVEVTIVQTEQQAVLNWKKFDVGKKTTLTFDQSAGGADRGKWVAFNRVNDPSGRPSQILGSLKADGQVYVINQNGIIFGGTSQVNVHTLVAAALPINANLIARGLLDNPDAEFLFNALQVDDLEGILTADTPVGLLSQRLDEHSKPRLTATGTLDGEAFDITLKEGVDYTLALGSGRQATVTLTPVGLARIEGENLTLTKLVANYDVLNGDVTVQKGAQLESPTTPQRVGGRIALFGANVRNAGTISTPDGQAILAGGLQVGLAAHSGDDPSLRGLDVFVGEVTNPASKDAPYAGRAINDGLIDVPRANATIAGRSVQQNGVIESSTSVSLNGRIDLDAIYGHVSNQAYDPTSASANARVQFVPRSSGVVTLGEGSVTRILPELGSAEKVAGTELALSSQVNARGLAVHLEKDAAVLAPSGAVSVKAGLWNFVASNGPQPPASEFIHSAGQIYAETGVLIDVAGTSAVEVALAERILTLELRGSELADSPLQRDGALRGVPITVDARLAGTFNGRDWIGTPLGDATGFLGLIERNVAQLTATGGTVDLRAGNSVVLNRGATIDVSGGWLQNEGGVVKTTKLRQGSRLVDIADATPDQVYDGIYDPKFTQVHSKWGITKTFLAPLALTGGSYEAGYIEGTAGGSIALTAPAMALDGKLAGNTVIGPRQLRETATSSTAPAASKLALTFRAQDTQPIYGDELFVNDSPTPPTVVFDRGAAPRRAGLFAVDAEGTPLVLGGAKGDIVLDPYVLRRDRREEVVLDPGLFTTAGFGELAVDNSAGDILLPAAVDLTLAPKSSLTLSGRNVEILGTVTAPGGSIKITAHNLSPYFVSQFKQRGDDPFTVPTAAPKAGRFVLGASAALSTAGLTIDERNLAPDAVLPAVALDGGAIDITAYIARLEAGSLVDVSGGVQVTTATEVTWGDAGAIAIRGGRDPNLAALFPLIRGDAPTSQPDLLLGGRLRISGELRGYSGAKGGSLALQAPFVQVGGRAIEPGTLLLQPEFFDRGGFTNFDLTGLGGARFGVAGAEENLPGVVIAADTVLAPRVRSLLLDPLGTDGELTITRGLKPRGERSAVSLAFHSLGLSNDAGMVINGATGGSVARGDLVMEAGAEIRTDPGASVEFSAATITLLGRVSAPAGGITLAGGTDSVSIFEQIPGQERAMPTVYLGSESRLSVAGATVLTPDPRGRRIGSVLAGGTIAVSGNIVASRGAVLDVSGASGILDLTPTEANPAASTVVPVNSGLNAPLSALATIPTRVDSDAGTITLAGGDQLFTAATLVGRAGGPTAQGGSLLVSADRFSVTGNEPAAINLVVTQSQRALAFDPLPSAFGPGEQSAVGHPVTNAAGEPRTPRGYFAVDRFLEGGFDSLTLGGNVRFKGAVDIAARGRIAVATTGFLSADAAVTLTAPSVALGTPLVGPLLPEQPKNPFTFAGQPFAVRPYAGPGRLTVHADLIDLGNLSLQGIRRANFLAPGGDIRGSGTVHIAGRMRLTAGQIYPPTGADFTLVAYDFADFGAEPGAALLPGTITIQSAGSRQLPLAAGGTLSIYATEIEQSGVLRAPIGTINLGWDGTGPAPVDALAGATKALPITRRLVLGRDSVTSVSAVEPTTGAGILIPYGVSLDGNSWIAPNGVDITSGGLPTKEINLSATNIRTRAGSEIDLRGGGDLYAYRWVGGLGGTRDILASEGSFAVIPGYEANFAPVAPFNPSELATNFIRDPANIADRDAGYVNSRLRPGDRVTLGASAGLSAGTYTLLPARYALLPGAVLVTPQSGASIGTLALADGSSIVSGTRANDLAGTRPGRTLFTRFEVAPADVVRSRASYLEFSANSFLRDKALALNVGVPVRPIDSGHLVFQATERLALRGDVLGRALSTDGRDAFIDVSSTLDMLIADSPTRKVPRGTLVLDAGRLSDWGAESLLLGGVRRPGADGATIAVHARSLALDNVGDPLTGPEIILAARDALTLARRSELRQSGGLSGPAERLTVDGEGALVRVSSDPAAEVRRTNVTTAGTAKLTVGAGVVLAGTSLTLDSSNATDLNSRARLLGDYIALSSGQISLRLDGTVPLRPTKGLVLAGRALRDIQGVAGLSLSSYSSLDIYGDGNFRVAGALAVHAAQIRGFQSARDRARFSASSLLIDNLPRGVRLAATEPARGNVRFAAGTIELGAGRTVIDQFRRVELEAARGILLTQNGTLVVQNDLVTRTPLVTADPLATHTILARGALRVLGDARAAPASFGGGIGASLTLQGTSVTVASDIELPSGVLTARATRGDLTVAGRLDVGGTEQAFNDLLKFTSAGEIALRADAGNIKLAKRGALVVDANARGGDAGSVTLAAPEGLASLRGELSGRAGARGQAGTFALDVRELPVLGGISRTLDEGFFGESRSFRVRQGDVLIDAGGTVRHFSLSADQGSLRVTGRIDASGDTGGSIRLAAHEDVVLTRDAVLTVAAKKFDHAGKGGAITLEAGAQRNGVVSPDALLDLQSGSLLDLSVARATATSASLGRFTGTLHLRAPQDATSTDLQIAAIAGTIRGASSIIAEGYKLFDLTATNGVINTAVRTSVRNNGIAFLGDGGTTTVSFTAMLSRLLGGNAGLESVFSIRQGAELYRPSGNITIGSETGSAATAALGDFDLATFRFGPKKAPGILTIRAPDNLVFLNALSDGFVSSRYNSALLAANADLPMNAQSWSYRLAAGADLSAADFRAVTPLARLAAEAGSLFLGRFNGDNRSNSNGSTNSPNPTSTNNTTAGSVQGNVNTGAQNRYQVIRTGSGDIEISAARDVQLRNHFATIYTAGTKIADATLGGTFDPPVTVINGTEQGSTLGGVQQSPAYPVQFTLGGGNVVIRAGGDIAHVTQVPGSPEIVADSQRQLPINWLYRRGFVDPATGQFGLIPARNLGGTVLVGGDVASTSWWVDFSNFFEGVGALGGGNVSLLAGNDVSNVDAAVPTNARLPKTATRASQLVELGGGDLLVRAGRNIDAGVYYVERGEGVLTAGSEIKTNATRAPSGAPFRALDPIDVPASEAWLPTTLFLGKGSFDVSARGDVLLGPVANPFLLPGGINNTIWYKTYFSTYAPTSRVTVASLGGSVTLRTTAALPGRQGDTTPLLQAWLETQLLLRTGQVSTASYYQPWLRLNEANVEAFPTAVSLLPPTLDATAFSGDVNLVGTLNLVPAARGTVNLAAAGSINGLQPTGSITRDSQLLVTWGTSRINLSDATPSAIPGVLDPYSYREFAGPIANAAGPARATQAGYLLFLDQLFRESGALDAVLQTKQTLHAPGPLHADDPEPVRLYARAGDISGLTLFSPKATRIVAGQDITDNTFYIQNLAPTDISVVSAGRNLVASNANSPLRTLAQAPGNLPPGNTVTSEAPLAGDIQVSGPGTIAVLAGGNLDLGTGDGNPDGTGAGIITVGNARNPYLPFAGANIVGAAGIGPSAGLADSTLDFEAFIDEFLTGDAAAGYLQEIDPRLTAAAFAKLPLEARNRVALEAFYRVLRDAGRSQTANDGKGGYANGFAAIAALFPDVATEDGTPLRGDITTRSRNIRTKSGGDISLFVPRGELTLASTVIGNPQVPPGIITETGGNVSIFAAGDIDIGIGRIFTLRGGNAIIWSSTGDIAAGASAKTVKSAPPTRVLVDPQSADVQTDLAGLATGGGIGVLATVAGVAPGDVDLIAPVGVVDAGDAGIRVSGNLNIAATAVLNAGNITVAGSTTGVPVAPVVAAPNIAGLTAANTTAGAANAAANDLAHQARQQSPAEETPSDITVEVLGYGGGEDSASL